MDMGDRVGRDAQESGGIDEPRASQLSRVTTREALEVAAARAELAQLLNRNAGVPQIVQRRCQRPTE